MVLVKYKVAIQQLRKNPNSHGSLFFLSLLVQKLLCYSDTFGAPCIVCSQLYLIILQMKHCSVTYFSSIKKTWCKFPVKQSLNAINKITRSSLVYNVEVFNFSMLLHGTVFSCLQDKAKSRLSEQQYKWNFLNYLKFIQSNMQQRKDEWYYSPTKMTKAKAVFFVYGVQRDIIRAGSSSFQFSLPKRIQSFCQYLLSEL